MRRGSVQDRFCDDRTGHPATALYVRTNLLKESPQLAPLRPTVGITPQLSDAELVTLAMMQALPGLPPRPGSCVTPVLTLAPVPRTCRSSPATTTAVRCRIADPALHQSSWPPMPARWTRTMSGSDSTPVECGRLQARPQERSSPGRMSRSTDTAPATSRRPISGLPAPSHAPCTALPVAFALTGRQGQRARAMCVPCAPTSEPAQGPAHPAIAHGTRTTDLEINHRDVSAELSNT